MDELAAAREQVRVLREALEALWWADGKPTSTEGEDGRFHDLAGLLADTEGAARPDEEAVVRRFLADPVTVERMREWLANNEWADHDAEYARLALTALLGTEPGERP